MAIDRTTRRSLLRSGGGLAAVLGTGGLAGCLDQLGGSGSASVLSTIPDGNEAVFTIDANTLLDDDGVRRSYNAWLAAQQEMPDYDGPTTLAGWLDRLEREAGLDPRAFSRLTGFFTYGGRFSPVDSDSTGFVLEADWDEETLVSQMENSLFRYEESTYAGTTIYSPSSGSSLSIGVLGDGRYVLARPDPLRATIDVDRGEAASLEGPVAGAFEDTRAGPLRFASTVEASWLPADVSGRGSPIDLSPVRAIDTAAGAVYREGNVRGVEVTLDVPDGETAKNLVDVLDGLLTVGAAETNDETVGTLLQDTSVTRDGAAAVVSLERTVSELENIGQSIGERAAADTQREFSPVANFDFAYDESAGTVTITHNAGDAISAAELEVQGQGFADVAAADMTEPGPWSGSRDEDGNVTAGHAVVVGVTPEFELRVVWQGTDTSAVLDEFEGPRA